MKEYTVKTYNMSLWTTIPERHASREDESFVGSCELGREKWHLISVPFLESCLVFRFAEN